MAIAKTVSISIGLVGDGSATSLTVDLDRDPFQLSTPLENWFLDEARANAPTGVSAANTSHGVVVSGATLSGSVVTINFATAPAAGVQDSLGITLNY